MNSRKLMSTIAAGVIAATTVITPSSVTFGYSSELESAYTWAYENGVTTVKGIDNANMMGNLTRVAMAKMLANYAINKLGRTPDTSIACNFSDVSAKMDADYDNGVTKACQLGIMGRDEGKVASSFNPNGIVTRAQFGTALSRVLWPNQVKDTNPYYVNHLNALKKAGIMTQINPDQKEVRGYVMIMLQRSAGMVNSEEEATEKCSIAQQLLCILEEGDCPEACEDVVKDQTKTDDEKDEDDEKEVVKSGKMVVTNEENEDGVVLSYGYTSELDTINFATDEEVTINSITLEREGLSTNEAIDAIWLENEEGVAVTSEKSISASKDTVTLSINKDYRTIDGDTSYVVVVRTTNTGSTDLGTNIGFKVNEIDSTAEKVTNKTSLNKYTFADYTGDGVSIDFRGTAGTKTYNYTEGNSYEVAKFKVTASSAAIKVKGFTFTNSGTLDIDDVESVRVLVDGTAIDDVTSSIKSNDLIVSFDPQEIAIKKNSTFTVEIVLNSDFEDYGHTAQFYFDESTDIAIVESKNGTVRVKIDTPVTSLISPVTYVFNGGKAMLTNTKIASTVDAAQDSDDVIIAEGNITLNGQSIKAKTLKITPSTGGIEAIRLLVNGDSYEATEKNEWTVKNVTIEEDSSIQIVADVEATAVSGTIIEFAVNGTTGVINSTSFANFQYEINNENAIFNGSISVSKLKVQAAKSSLINNSSRKAEFKVKDTTTNTVFDGTYTAKKGTTKINEIVIKNTSGSLATGDSVTFNVYIGNTNKPVTSVDYDKTTSSEETKTFDSIEIDNGSDVTVRVDATVYAATGTTDDLEYAIQINGIDENGNDVKTSFVSFVDMSFVDVQAVNVTTNAATKQKDVILSDKNQVVANFIVKPANKAETAIISAISLNSIKAVSDLVEDEYQVLIGGQDYADELEYTSDKGTGSSEDLNITINGETEVKVIYRGELSTGDSANVNVTINGETYQSTRTIVPAIVRITSQESVSDKTYTRYTFDVEVANSVKSTTITDVQLGYSGYTVDPIPSIVNGDSKSVKNDKESHTLKTITYKVDGVALSAPITNTNAPDFFEINGTPIVTFADK